jgi:polar amino acid transport system substrate-binding protein
VVPRDKAAEFETLDTLEGLRVAVESGSAGEAAALALGAETTALQFQTDTLLEVSAGMSDAAVIDLLMAGAMIGEGTSYENLTYILNLNDMQGLPSEEYGVGFRKGSDLTDVFNTFWAGKVADGTVLSTATTYGVQESVILD